MAVASAKSSIGTSDGEAVLGRYRRLIEPAMREALRAGRPTVQPTPATSALLDDFYAQIEYHLGWRHPDLSQARAHPGKYLRPTLLLLACELVAGSRGLHERERHELVVRALPAAVTVELIHNFSLVHDDIEDGDEERRHRPTLWKLWGIPQAINTGDGIFALARAGLWRLAESGVPSETVVRLAALADRTCLELCEGQYLDMSFERRHDVTVEMYLEMIGRKTAALIACAMEMGAVLGAPDDAALATEMASFGRALGLAFQLRDDLLGIWAAQELLGKTPAGDLRRKKMSLPVIHALEQANTGDAEAHPLRAIYAEAGPATDEQIAVALGVLERTGAHTRIRSALREQGALAYDALDRAAHAAPESREAHGLLAALLRFVLAAADEEGEP
jgi:geranylgeranyl diphosphate synthase type I